MWTRSIAFLLMLLLSTSAATDKVVVSGKPIAAFTLSIDQLRSKTSVDLGDIVIYNHEGDSVNLAKQVKGVPFSSIKAMFKFNDPTSKNWTAYRFVFEAEDGYKVVFSWSELFNSKHDVLYFITSKNGKQMDELKDRIQLVAPADVQTGRRYLKYLKRIVCKAD